VAVAAPDQARAAAAKPLPPPGLDDLVARAMKTFEVPGLAVSIVKDGEVVAAQGYGVRRLGQPARVDADTRFGIASNTKVFTAVALGLLVEEQQLEWDAPVVRYLPWFQMWDPWVTRELTIRDLLVHRSGLALGAGDLLWWPPTTYDRREIAKRLRFLPTATSFRSAYAYDNVLYLVAGEVIEAVSGQSWEDFVAARILARVGMRDSTVRHSSALEPGNVAATHAPVEGEVRVVAPFGADNANPAAGINATAADMARWMLVLLGEGRLADGTRLYGDRTARELVSMVTPLALGTPPQELEAQRANFRGYALGLNVADYRGRKVVSHTGGLPGYVSRVTWLPELELGVSVLTNQESGEAFNAITYAVIDHYLGAPHTDWVDAYRRVRERNATRTADAMAKAEAARARDSRP
jgi:CubicO group peptidase (beta-lactamase class C family)